MGNQVGGPPQQGMADQNAFQRSALYQALMSRQAPQQGVQHQGSMQWSPQLLAAALGQHMQQQQPQGYAQQQGPPLRQAGISPQPFGNAVRSAMTPQRTGWRDTPWGGAR